MKLNILHTLLWLACLSLFSACVFVDNLQVDSHYGVGFVEGDTLLVGNFYGQSDRLSEEQSQILAGVFARCEGLEVLESSRFMDQMHRQLLPYPLPYKPDSLTLQKLGRITGAKYLLTGRLLDTHTHPLPVDYTYVARRDNLGRPVELNERGGKAAIGNPEASNPKWVRLELAIYDLRDQSQSLQLYAKVQGMSVPLRKGNNLWHLYVSNNIQKQGVKEAAKSLYKHCECLK